MLRKARRSARSLADLRPSSGQCSTDGGTRRARLRRLLESQPFEAFLCALILANMVLLGVEVQVTRVSTDTPLFFHVAENVFTIGFAVEIAVRLYATGLKLFRQGENRLWNVLDVVLVTASVFQALMDLFQDVVILNFNAGRVFRMFRMVRAFRIIRVMKLFRPLRILIHSLMDTVKSLMWVLTLLSLIIYLFGMLFTIAVGESIHRGTGNMDLAVEHFGCFLTSTLSLYKAMTGGENWHVYSDSLEAVGAGWAFLFLCFVAFVQFAVMNVITGVVCQGAIEAAQQDQDAVVQTHLTMKQKYVRELMEVFNYIDFDGSGTLSLQEFEAKLEDPALKNYFAAMGMTVDEAWSLFKLLDDNEEDGIDPPSFVSGCLKLKGAARSMDVHMLMYESRWMMARVTTLARDLDQLKKDVMYCVG